MNCRYCEQDHEPNARRVFAETGVQVHVCRVTTMIPNRIYVGCRGFTGYVLSRPSIRERTLSSLVGMISSLTASEDPLDLPLNLTLQDGTCYNFMGRLRGMRRPQLSTPHPPLGSWGNPHPENRENQYHQQADSFWNNMEFGVVATPSLPYSPVSFEENAEPTTYNEELLANAPQPMTNFLHRTRPRNTMSTPRTDVRESRRDEESTPSPFSETVDSWEVMPEGWGDEGLYHIPERIPINVEQSIPKVGSVIGKLPENRMEACSICMTDLTDRVFETVCTHHFCYNCIRKCLSEGIDTCPNCRQHWDVVYSP